MTSDKAYRVGVAILAVLGVLAARWIRFASLGDTPHVQDEFAYLFQAKTYALGQLGMPPLLPRAAFNSWFLEDRGERFAIFPPGWPVVLALFLKLGLANWANPVLHGATILLVARAGRRAWSNAGGLIAALLYASSPQTIVLAASLMSHGIVALASAATAVVLVDMFNPERKLAASDTALAGALLGLTVLARPLCAAILGLLYVAAFVWKVWRREATGKVHVGTIAAGAAAGATLFALYNARVTGNAWYTPQSMYFDSHLAPANLPLFNYHFGCNSLGFGPGHGCDFSIAASTHTIANAAMNTGDNIRAWALLLGGGPSVLLLGGLGFLTGRDPRVRLLGVGVLGTIGAYALYWYAGTCFGARFYHVAVPFLILLATAFLLRIAGRYFRVAASVVLALIVSNVAISRAVAKEIEGDYWGTDSRFVQLKKSWTKGPAVIMLAFDMTEAIHRPLPERPLFWTTQLVKGGFWMANITANGAIGLNDLELNDEVVFAKFHPALVESLRDRFKGRSLWLYTATVKPEQDTLEEWGTKVVAPAIPMFFPPDNFDGYDFARPVLMRAPPIPSLEEPQ